MIFSTFKTAARHFDVEMLTTALTTLSKICNWYRRILASLWKIPAYWQL
jgi:hypothetical protein